MLEKERDGFILEDHFPNNDETCSYMMQCLGEMGIPINKIIYLRHDTNGKGYLERVMYSWIHKPSGRIYNEIYAPTKQACITNSGIVPLDDITGERCEVSEFRRVASDCPRGVWWHNNHCIFGHDNPPSRTVDSWFRTHKELKRMQEQARLMATSNNENVSDGDTTTNRSTQSQVTRISELDYDEIHAGSSWKRPKPIRNHFAHPGRFGIYNHFWESEHQLPPRDRFIAECEEGPATEDGLTQVAPELIHRQIVEYFYPRGLPKAAADYLVLHPYGPDGSIQDAEEPEVDRPLLPDVPAHLREALQAWKKWRWLKVYRGMDVLSTSPHTTAFRINPDVEVWMNERIDDFVRCLVLFGADTARTKALGDGASLLAIEDGPLAPEDDLLALENSLLTPGNTMLALEDDVRALEDGVFGLEDGVLGLEDDVEDDVLALEDAHEAPEVDPWTEVVLPQEGADGGPEVELDVPMDAQDTAQLEEMAEREIETEDVYQELSTSGETTPQPTQDAGEDLSSDEKSNEGDKNTSWTVTIIAVSVAITGVCVIAYYAYHAVSRDQTSTDGGEVRHRSHSASLEEVGTLDEEEAGVDIERASGSIRSA